MIFNCGPTLAEKHKAKEKWHTWFAWRPVRMGKTNKCAWLETVQRKGKYYPEYPMFWDWEYK